MSARDDDEVKLSLVRKHARPSGRAAEPVRSATPLARERGRWKQSEWLELGQGRTSGMLWTTDARLRITGVLGHLLDAGQQWIGCEVGDSRLPLFFDEPAHQRALSGKSIAFEVQEERLVYSVTIDPLLDREGAVQGVVGLVQDVSSRKLAQDEARQSQKMEAIGRLAGGVAHDFNNMLTGMLGYATLIQRKMGDSAPPEVREIQRAGARASALTRQLLAFSRRDLTRPQTLDLVAVVEDMAGMLDRMVTELVDIEIVGERRAHSVFADRSQIEQVVMNLVVNAKEAMPKGGIIRISVEAASAEEAAALASGNELVVLRVSDDGVGIDQEDQTRIFEPFFTTKAETISTGLGLSTVYGIVHQSEGFITIDSAVGSGTTFNVFVPRGHALPELEPSSEPAPRSRGHETVLVVDDDDMVRQVVSHALAAAGYKILAASGPQAALDVAKQHERDIQLMVADVVMPRMSGVQLVHEFKKVCPQAKTLLISGYPADDKGSLGAADDFLSKPFSPETIATRVRRVLDRDA